MMCLPIFRFEFDQAKSQSWGGLENAKNDSLSTNLKLSKCAG